MPKPIVHNTLHQTENHRNSVTHFFERKYSLSILFQSDLLNDMNPEEIQKKKTEE